MNAKNQPNSRTLWLLVVVIVASIAILLKLSSYSQNDYGSKEQNAIDYRFEVILPLTGNLAFLGVPIKNALELAEEDWEQKLSESDISIELLFGDSQGAPAKALSIHKQNAATGKVDATFSFLSGQTLALKPVVAESGGLFVAATVDPSVTENSTNMIRPYYSFGAEANAILEVIKEEAPATVGMIYSLDSATAYAAENITLPGLRSMGINTSVETFKVGQREFRNQVVSVKNSNPDIVLTNGFGSDLPFLINTLREQEVFPPAQVIGPIGIADAIPSQGTDPFRGVKYFGPPFLLPGYEQENDIFSKFKARYIEQYNAKQFGESSVYAYDAYSLLAKALLNTRSSEAGTLFLHMVENNLGGLAGEYDFDVNGNTNLPVAYSHIEDTGEIKLLRVFE